MVLDNVDGNQLYAIATVLNDVSEKLAWDDMYDTGWYTYYDRPKGNPHIGWGKGVHESPLHHWQIAGFGMAISKLLGVLAVSKQMMDAENEEIAATNAATIAATTPKEPEYFKRIL